MKDLIVIYLIIQAVFALIAYLKFNMPEGLIITIVPAVIIAFIIRRLIFGKIE